MRGVILNQFLSRTNGLQLYLIITLPAFLLSFLMSRFVVVRPRVQLSQMSAISAMQIWYWLIVLFTTVIFIWFYLKYNPKFDSFVSAILYLGISLNVAFVSAANNLALSKIPLPPGDIRGDNLNLLMGMIRAQETGWSGNSYPPVWLSLVGNIATFTGNNVLEVWKPVFLLSVVLLPSLILLAWRQAFSPMAAAAITFLFTFSTIEWKGIANFALFAMFIAIAHQISKEKEKTFKFDSRLFALGLILGLSALTYFGHLWWVLLALAALIVGLWFSKQREYLLIKVVDAGLGVALIFGPSQVGPRFGLSGITIVALVSLLILFRLLSQKSSFISGTVGYLTGLLVPTTVLFIIFTTTVNDNWFYDGLEVNPSPNLGFGFNASGILFFLITIFGLIIAFRSDRYRSAILVLTTFFISSTLMMFWFAARMEVTGLVELFPRASGTFSFSWTILSFIAIYVLLKSDYLKNFFKKIWPGDLSKAQSIFLVLVVLLPLAVTHARILSDSQRAIFPIAENGVWLAYRACDNPHEDPMLAKVFEEQPFIQDFLRENCQKADWKVIPPLNPEE